jgi:hypothetical protein
MTDSDEAFSTRLRQLLLDTSEEIHPTRSAPAPDSAFAESRLHTNRPVPRTMAIAFVSLLVLAIFALTFSFRSGSKSPAAGTVIPGSLVAIETSGAVVVMNPNTGNVERTLVRPSPVIGHGPEIKMPYAVSATSGYVYVAYTEPVPRIYRVPFNGGPLSYVTDGIEPSVSSDGTQLAFVRVSNPVDQSGSSEQIILRDLATGSERSVYDLGVTGVVTDISWSPDGNELSITGIKSGVNSSPFSEPPNVSSAVTVLDLGRPLSSHNPRLLITDNVFPGQHLLSDAQFVGSGTVAVLSSRASACYDGSTDLLDVKASSGASKIIASLHLVVTQVQFDSAGPAIFDGITGKCMPGATTTTAVTTPPTMNLGSTKPGSSSGTTFSSTVNIKFLVLDKWENGKAVKIASGVVAVALVP